MAFGWDDGFLLAMSAAGAIISTKQAGEQQKLIKLGRQLETSALETNLEALRAQNSESSLDAIKSLRENVSNQIAINAARGVASGAGSAQGAISSSENAYATDEKTRRMNLLVKENELRAANVISGFHTLASETKVGQSLTNQIFNNLPVSSLSKLFKTDKEKIGKSEIPSWKSAFGIKEVNA
jgi:transcriptional regulator of heat shock response